MLCICWASLLRLKLIKGSKQSVFWGSSFPINCIIARSLMKVSPDVTSRMTVKSNEIPQHKATPAIKLCSSFNQLKCCLVWYMVQPWKEVLYSFHPFQRRQLTRGCQLEWFCCGWYSLTTYLYQSFCMRKEQMVCSPCEDNGDDSLVHGSQPLGESAMWEHFRQFQSILA